jgi:hypothetical protein
MHFRRRPMAKLKYLVLHGRFERKVFPFPCPIYMAIHGLLRRKQEHIVFIYSVCRFLRKEKITYYIDILRGFSVKTKQQHI